MEVVELLPLLLRRFNDFNTTTIVSRRYFHENRFRDLRPLQFAHTLRENFFYLNSHIKAVFSWLVYTDDSNSFSADALQLVN